MRRKNRRPGWVNLRTGRPIPEEAALQAEMPPNVCWVPAWQEAPTRWLAGDVDGIRYPFGGDWINDPAEAAQWVIDNHFPPEFRGRSFWYQITGSALDPSNPDAPRDVIKLRIAFWLDRGLTRNQLRHWFRGRPVDLCTFDAIQAIYTANPTFEGLRDPVPVPRSGVVEGDTDTVVAPDTLPPPAVNDDDPLGSVDILD